MSTQTRIGSVVDDKYQVIEALGKGGMANVWLARDCRLGKLWAIKEIKPNAGGAHGAALRQAIIDEAHFMKRLDHPAIPRVVDILDTGASIYVVMDYVDGRPLSQVLRMQGHPFSQDEVIEWGLQLCDVLGYLHASVPSVIYRDMKPSNVILRDDGSVRLIDFGIAMERLSGANNDGRIVGTPGYAPPEQIPQPMPWPEPEQLDPAVTIDERTDVYSLGATLYTLVTGHTPRCVLDADGHRQTSFDMRPIRAWNPALSEGLERILARATNADSRERYASMDEMSHDLRHYEELTQEWRRAQLRKVAQFRRVLAATCVTCLCGVLFMASSAFARSMSYEECMHAASEASCEAAPGKASPAEELYTAAMRIAPENTAPYQGLIEVYQHDFRLTADEDERLRKTFGKALELQENGDYARLCFDVGVCYLSYFGIEDGGGSVGNAAIASIDAAAPWFRRVTDVCDRSQAGTAQDIDSADVRAAGAYGVIADFYKTVTRAGREGRSAAESYREVWEALCSELGEVDTARSQQYGEGVRIRLCQVAAEALSSSTYLAGFRRAGITEEQATELLERVRACRDELESFARANEYREVYGPVFAEIDGALQIAEQNRLNVYANPVASQGLVPLEEGEES